MAVAVEIASASLSVQKLLILPFLAAAMLDFPLPVLPEIAQADRGKCRSHIMRVQALGFRSYMVWNVRYAHLT